MAQLDLAGWPDYLKPIAETLGEKYEYVSSIAEGKTGATYKIADRLSKRSFCLKTIATKVVDNKRSDVKDTLKKEVEILDPLSHKAIPQIYERELSSQLPYYVCTFHPGQTVIAFKEAGKRLTSGEAIFVIQQLMDALRYLHDRGRTHCDFHQNNILIHEEVFTHGILIIDFGSGHRESDSSAETVERGDFRYKQSPAQARYREPISRSKAGENFRASDFAALGHLLALLAECFFNDAPRDQQIAYRDFCHLLKSGQIGDWESARVHFATVVDPGRLITSSTRFFVTSAGSRQSIRIPVSGDVPVGEAVLAVVNSTYFQRLKGLKQLSFCEWVYAGGVHTRYEHSLGVMNVTLRALNKLARDSAFRDRFTQQNVEGTILASLVHDIGHYPFAHVIEHYVTSRFPGDKEAKRLAHHARYTIETLENDTGFSELVDRHWGINIRLEAIKILEGTVPVVAELLDGPIDCDKLDYLQRDALHCGVPFGAGIDIERIVSSYRYLEKNSRLGIDRSGVTAVEGLIITQDQMLDTVYWNEVIRGVTAMFHAIIGRLVKRDLTLLGELVTELRQHHSEYQALREVIVPWISKRLSTEQAALRPLYNLHLEPSYTDIFVSIKRYSAMDTAPNKSVARLSVYDSIIKQPSSQTSTLPIEWQAVVRLRDCYRAAFAEKNSSDRIGYYEVLVDVPWGKAGNRMVYVSEDGSSEQRIVDVSHIGETIFHRPTMHLAPIRVFISPRLRAQYEQHLNAIVASAESRFYDSSVPDVEARNDE
jgi:HD superfamily phosphohydrolase